MSVQFTLNDEGYLDWRYQGNKRDLDTDEARVIAEAEIASALGQIAEEIRKLGKLKQ